jgi:hypothetical protein
MAKVRYTNATADKLVVRGPCLYYGYIVNVALSAAVCDMRDGVAAGGGNVVDTIAASSAAGVRGLLLHPIQLNNGLFIDFAGTGTITVLYEGDAPA